ncbi:agamous-like mads-box protein agl62 [Phtheirospermum japonicum]|uniref:Agamous-like mads-box protein agl62 n=1 Tax=Phtheirospermum japonicum TaxID=374723 RepID=A0A830BGG9_9LAMI|nr:agamous-like mads-box protein agl62 [Phtheirospermum japonicum]
MGRRKIALDQKIQKKAHLQVTFTKRRQGLFRKASELSVLCGAEIAILVRSPAGKIFAFGSPSADAVIGRFEGRDACSSEWQIIKQVEGRAEYEEAVRELEVLKRVTQEGAGDQMWWEKSLEAMDLQELERFAQDLEILGGQCLAECGVC